MKTLVAALLLAAPAASAQAVPGADAPPAFTRQEAEDAARQACALATGHLKQVRAVPVELAPAAMFIQHGAEPTLFTDGPPRTREEALAYVHDELRYWRAVRAALERPVPPEERPGFSSASRLGADIQRHQAVGIIVSDIERDAMKAQAEAFDFENYLIIKASVYSVLSRFERCAE
jgi:hypothetical protein